MDNEKKDLNDTENIVDNDKLDIQADDEVISEDILDSSEESKSITNIDIDSNITVGEAIENSEKEKDNFKPDPEVDAAVDEIVRSESDESIAIADAKIAALEEKKSKITFRQKIKNVLSAWWNNVPVRYGSIAAFLFLIIAVTLLPATRYGILNLTGVRVSSSMIVVDSQTRLPLKNINVQLQNQEAKTNDDGEVSFSGLKLGNSDLKIIKRGYADKNEEIVLGWGSNPLGEQSIVATGEQFTFVLSDWKSGASITDAEANAGESSAKADDEGKIVLTVGEDENLSEIEVSITAENYREEKITSEQLSDKEIQLKLVPSKKHVFVSNRDGNYDLYKIDIDGKNEEILKKATSKEREVPLVSLHPTKDLIAFTSSRDGEENRDGYILDGLYIIDVNTGEEDRIARSEQLQVIGWSGDTLVYLQIVEGTSAGNDERSKILSYNVETKERKDLAASNYFNDVELVDDKLYYAVSSFAVPESQAKLFTVNIDGENNNKLIDYQVWNIFRTEYNKLLFSAVDQRWFELTNDEILKEIAQQPAPLSLKFVNSPNNKRSTWVEIRDGKGVLLKTNTEEIKEEQVISMPGLYEVLYWTDNSTVIFRVINSSETADYLINLDGGDMQKITDVTAARNTYF
jgi:hypothetical protein